MPRSTDDPVKNWGKVYLVFSLWNASAAAVSGLRLFPISRPVNYWLIHLFSAVIFFLIGRNLLLRKESGRRLLAGYTLISAVLTAALFLADRGLPPFDAAAPAVFVAEKFSIFYSLVIPFYSLPVARLILGLHVVYAFWVLRYFTRGDIKEAFQAEPSRAAGGVREGGASAGATADPAGVTGQDPAPGRPSRSGLATASFVISLLFFIPVLSGMLAVILGSMAHYRVGLSRDRLKGKGLASAGTAIGIVQLVAIIAVLLTLAGSLWGSREEQIARAHARGVDQLTSGLHEEAGRSFQDVRRSAQQYLASAHYHLGTIRMNRGEFDEALKAFDQAVSLNPQMYDAYQNRAVTLRKMGQYQKSVEACRDIIGKFPRTAKTRSSMGLAYEKMGRYKQAARAHLDALDQSSQWQFAKQRLAAVLAEIDDRDFVLSMLGRLGEIDPALARKVEEDLALWEKYQE